MNSASVKYKRILKIKLPKHQTTFLWGARKTGKSTYLKNHFPEYAYYNLLKSDIYLRFSKEPSLFREEVLALSKPELKNPIIIDEVQKIPVLLDEIHHLIEEYKLSFILCGSSARKLKRGAANLLGGRAWSYYMHPLVYPEITNFDLLMILNRGLIPSHYMSTNYKKSLTSYVSDYLKEEIQSEGLVRNLPYFARFLDSLAFSNGELINYSNIARDCGVDSKTIKEYYQILIDTLIGYYIQPFTKKSGRDTILSTPKFYLFDVGVAGYLSKRKLTILKGTECGKAFEHYILMELIAYTRMKGKDYEIKFWRTKTGLEVDFILENGKVAIEVKLSNKVDKTSLKGLIAFQEENPNTKAYVVSLDPRPRKLKTENNNEISILPYKTFLEKLWSGSIS